MVTAPKCVPNSNLSNVSKLILQDPNTWDSQLVNFLPFEPSQILQLPHPASHRHDQIIWDPHTKGIFLIKSVCHSIKNWESSESTQNSSHDANSKVWKNLWNLQTIPKHIHLIWKIWHNAIHVKKNLPKKNVDWTVASQMQPIWGRHWPWFLRLPLGSTCLVSSPIAN